MPSTSHQPQSTNEKKIVFRKRAVSHWPSKSAPSYIDAANKTIAASSRGGNEHAQRAETSVPLATRPTRLRRRRRRRKRSSEEAYILVNIGCVIIGPLTRGFFSLRWFLVAGDRLAQRLSINIATAGVKQSVPPRQPILSASLFFIIHSRAYTHSGDITNSIAGSAPSQENART